MKFFIIPFFLLFFETSWATMSPRMYSIMVQMSGTIKENSRSDESTQYNNKIGIDLLYLVRGGPTFGGRYLIESRNQLETEVGEGYGPVAGYYWENGTFILVNYDILAKLGRWRNGEGFQAEIGYVEHIGNRYHIGFKYSQRDVTYKTDLQDNTAEKKRIIERFPAIVFMYLF